MRSCGNRRAKRCRRRRASFLPTMTFAPSDSSSDQLPRASSDSAATRSECGPNSSRAWLYSATTSATRASGPSSRGRCFGGTSSPRGKMRPCCDSRRSSPQNANGRCSTMCTSSTSGQRLFTSARSTQGSFATAACASDRRTAKKPRCANGSTVSRTRLASTRCSSPCTRRVRNGQRSAPIQPLTSATTGSATSASASVQARMRSSALMPAPPASAPGSASTVRRIRSPAGARPWAPASGWSCPGRC